MNLRPAFAGPCGRRSLAAAQGPGQRGQRALRSTTLRSRWLRMYSFDGIARRRELPRCVTARAECTHHEPPSRLVLQHVRVQRASGPTAARPRRGIPRRSRPIPGRRRGCTRSLGSAARSYSWSGSTGTVHELRGAPAQHDDRCAGALGDVLADDGAVFCLACAQRQQRLAGQRLDGVGRRTARQVRAASAARRPARRASTRDAARSGRARARSAARAPSPRRSSSCTRARARPACRRGRRAGPPRCRPPARALERLRAARRSCRRRRRCCRSRRGARGARRRR